MKLREALRRLRTLYPEAEIKTISTSSGQMIVRDGSFVAWVIDGEVDRSSLPNGEAVKSNIHGLGF
jgi:topoisomerase IA-like protein